MDLHRITLGRLARQIDHTCTTPNATLAQITQLCAAAVACGFASVQVPGVWVKRCRGLLSGSEVSIGSFAGFPLGANTTESKLLEAVDAIENGASEISYVINAGAVLDGDFGAVRTEMRTLLEICRPNEAKCTAILEPCLLTHEQQEAVVQIAKEERPDFVTVGTGYGRSPSSRTLRRLRRCVGSNVYLRAMGGMQDWPACAEMLEAGATRLALENSEAVLRQFELFLAGGV